MKAYFFIALLSAIAFPFSVVSHWNSPALMKRPGEITQERTKPIIVGEILYTANLSGDVVAYHRLDGYPLWKARLQSGVEGAFSYGRSKIIVGDLKGTLYGLHARDGSEAWRFKIAGEWLGAPAIHRDKIFVGTSADEIYALTETHGREVWHYSHRGDEKMTVRGTSGPVVYGSDVFVGFSDGTVASLTTDKGKVNWTKRLRTRERFYDVDMSVYVDEEIVIAGTFDGKIYGLDRATGSTKWIYPAGSYGGFHVEGNRLYFAGLDGHFYCLDKSNSNQIWKTPFQGKVGLTPAKAGEYLVFTTSDDPAYVLDPTDGKMLWNGSLGNGTLTAATAAEDGWFYILSNYGHFFSYEIRKDRVEYSAPEVVRKLSAIERDLGKQIGKSSRN